MLEIWKIIGITFLPTLELRASIPYGVFGTALSAWLIFWVAVVTNIIVGILVYVFMDLIIKVLTRIPAVNKWWEGYTTRTRKKIEEGVEKYGEWAVAVFIGIPLPGSGVYTGALAAYLIGLRFRKFIVADIVGVLIAAAIVMAICLTGSNAWDVLIKKPI